MADSGLTDWYKGGDLARQSRDGSLGNALRRLREENRMGLKTAAPKADVTYSYLSKIENGHKTPTKGLIERLCEIYGADPDAMIALYGELPDDIKLIVQNNGKEVFELLRRNFSGKITPEI